MILEKRKELNLFENFKIQNKYIMVIEGILKFI